MYGFRSLDHKPHSVPEGARLRYSRLAAFRPLPERSPTAMKLSVVYQPAVPAGTSPYRVRDEQGRELDWANVFLDGQRLRQPDFIRREDFPVQPRYLPRPLSLQEDQLLQQELKRTDNLVANALLLMRATGIRIGECLDLSLDCLRQLEPERWALHVPLGKLHTERLVPADPELRQIVERI